MSLEAEAAKHVGLGPPSTRPPTAWDRFARAIALLILVAFGTLVFWVPFQFLGSIGAAVTLAILALTLITVASRVRVLSGRVRALEEALRSRAETEPTTAAPSTPEGSDQK